jgi:hypothetical protein
MRGVVTVVVCGAIGAVIGGYAAPTILYLRGGDWGNAFPALVAGIVAGAAIGAGAAIWALP